MSGADLWPALVDALTPLYGAGEANSMAGIFFEDAFGLRKQALFQHFFDKSDMLRYRSLSERLLLGEPVQYVVGKASFFGMMLTVTPAVLIPRPETEELVALMLETMPANAPLKVLDVGTGSGCIALALKKKRPNWQLYGLDRSKEALTVAEGNADMHLQPNAIQWNCGDALASETWVNFSSLDAVVSNPPYIPHREMSLVSKHVQQYEPAMALFVPDDDPLLFYRSIQYYAGQALRPGGHLFFECNTFYAADVAELLEREGWSSVAVFKDINGLNRMVTGIWQG